eukprot:4844513-Alexandrium_andersonii.AAC.1
MDLGCPAAGGGGPPHTHDAGQRHHADRPRGCGPLRAAPQAVPVAVGSILMHVVRNLQYESRVH